VGCWGVLAEIIKRSIFCLNMRSSAKGVTNEPCVCVAKLLQQASEDRPFFPSQKK
jgi:hypothetical protein